MPVSMSSVSVTPVMFGHDLTEAQKDEDLK